MKLSPGIALAFLLVARPLAAQPIRVGYFANITHAQALIGLADGSFQKALGPGVKIETLVFPAGPAAIEALFAGAVDLLYVGPNPAINAYVRSGGDAARVVAGAASGGARLIVRSDAGISRASDFAGKRLATPQLGNTQDVAARSWLKANGLKPADQGGTVLIHPLAPADQLSLFKQKGLDASWAVEPWASRLVSECGGKEFLDERKLWPQGRFTTAVVLVSRPYLAAHPEVIRAWLKAHVELTSWIRAHGKQARERINEQLTRLGKPLDPALLEQAFSHLEITYDPIAASLTRAAEDAFALGFLGKQKPDLSGLFDLTLLDAVLKEKGIRK
jgi:NitT/TauT family transport system substrate-binding protein